MKPLPRSADLALPRRPLRLIGGAAIAACIAALIGTLFWAILHAASGQPGSARIDLGYLIWITTVQATLSTGLSLLAGIALAIIYRNEIDPVAVRDVIAGSPFSPVIVLGLQVAASLLFIPRTVLGIAAGLVFGFFWGTVWALTGAMLGAAAGFALTRWIGAGGMLDTSPGIGRLVQRAEDGGWRAVAILRLTPLPHSAANTLLAMTNLKWRDYLLGSFAGMLPMTLAQVEVGAAGGAVLAGHGPWLLACLALAAGLLATFLLKRAGEKRGSQSQQEPLD